MTEPRTARKTVLIVGVVLLGIGLWSVWRAYPLRSQIFCGLAAYLLLLGALAPRWCVPFHDGWMKLAHVLGWINTRLLLGVLYYGIFSPLGVVRRLAGSDPLNRRRRRESYWIPRPKLRQDREQFERLF